MGLETGAMTGRFYRVPPGLSIRQNSVPRGAVREEVVSLCSESGGDPSSSEHALAYAGSGPSAFWFLREKRAPSKVVVEERAARLAAPHHLRQLRPRDRERVLGRARAEVLAEESPVVTVVPGALSGDLLWVGVRTLESDGPLLRAVIAALGVTLSPRYLFDPIGFQRLCLLLCSEELARDVDGDSRRNLSVTQVSARFRGGRVSGKMASVRSPLAEAIRVLDVTFDSISLSVASGEVSVDPSGPYRVVVPDSPGGLPRERISRRLEDADGVVSEVLELAQVSAGEYSRSIGIGC